MRIPVGTSLDKKLYKQIKMQALKEDVDANDLLEEGMRLVLEKRKNKGDTNG